MTRQPCPVPAARTLERDDIRILPAYLTRRRGRTGAAGYDPRMLLALRIYAYRHRVRSSREIERVCVSDVVFPVLCAQGGPDHATIARFRAQARDAFTDLSSQVLMIAAGAGLGRFGTVAIDGTKVAANASIDANRGKEWFDERVAAMVAESEHTDGLAPCERHPATPQDRLQTLNPRRYSSGTILQTPGGNKTDYLVR